MDVKNFIRECFLKSNPSVDLDLVKNPVDCCQHKLAVKTYEEIQEKYCKNMDEIFFSNMWMLQSGPQLVEE